MIYGRGWSSVASVLLLGLLTLGLFETSTVSAQSGEVCQPNPELALADGNDDGVISMDEIDAIIKLSGGNADIQLMRDQAVAAGITGIRYTDCDPNAGVNWVEGTPVATPINGTPLAAVTNVVGKANTDDAASAGMNGSKPLLLVGMGGVLVLAGGVLFRMGRKA